MSPAKANYDIARITNGTKQKYTFHDLKFSMTTNLEAINFEPLYVGLIYTVDGYALN